MLPYAALVFGHALLLSGLAMIHVPTALIVAGLEVIAAALFAELGEDA